MIVYKFGGASVKDAAGVRNVVSILQAESDVNLMIVISAMGKTTNALEAIVNAYYSGDAPSLDSVKQYHFDIMTQLFERNHPIYDEVNNLFVEIEWVIEDAPTSTYAYEYDQIVSVGELLSTTIISAYLNECGFTNRWLDARDIIRTDNTHRNARVDWELTQSLIQKEVSKGLPVLTQGFIGCTSENFTTTLGREGSDFTAAILAHAAQAEEVVIWKDVTGILNADPRFFEDAQKLKSLSYAEAIELAYFGAKVIHPKTIQPLKDKKIPLRVRSFVDGTNDGTVVSEGAEVKPFLPSFIVKENQVLLSISAQDLSFIVEDHLSHIFYLFSEYGVRVNVMQNSAVSFSVCVDDDAQKVPALIDALKKEYQVLYNDELTLYTIRHYNDDSMAKVLKDKTLLLEQKSRHTVQLVVR
ncbi:MAG: aspartate kinase [Flavobacteriales bacterium]|nr:aspartate kinase [Flavobacteriales bacterium]